MVDRIRELCKQNGVTISRLEEETGVSKNGICRWDTSIPSVNKVKAVADYFGVSVDFLLTGREVMLTESDTALLRKWAKLDDFGKEIAMFVIDGEISRSQAIREAVSRPIPIFRAVQTVSAGAGAEIGFADMERVFIDDSPEARRASFIVQVSGDSMLPKYRNGDQLLVEACDDVRIGEIGVFVVDGLAYVKERGTNELISLNPDFENIPFTGNVVCNGRVIGVLKKSDIK